jgi:hypothetical protein
MKLTDRFRPKKDARSLQEWNQAAWQTRSDALSERIKAEAGEALAAHIETLYPAQDMAVLAKYNSAITLTDVSLMVRVPDSDSWSEHFCIALPRAVVVAASYIGLYCGGPRFSQMPGYGLHAKSLEEIKAGKNDTFKSLESYLESHRETERKRLPEALEPLIFALAYARQQYKAEYKHIASWPKEYNAMHGVYPTWGEIAEQFPVTGALIQQAAQDKPKDAA